MAIPHPARAAGPVRTAVSPLPRRVDPIAPLPGAVHLDFAGGAGAQVIRVRGLVDRTSAAFLVAQIGCAPAERPRPVLVDLSGTTVADPATAAVLWRLRQSLRARGSRCAVVGPVAPVRLAEGSVGPVVPVRLAEGSVGSAVPVRLAGDRAG
ncbi:hypothetical protein GCM10010492_58910 [Saccharothrix mutabilis subsp. mutabilis]|uniref:STAS domain-containing protein n=1 Tax=Saccharothrix mutabilis subsp. mutabilis TaxID=66855 RepID=A0ABP3E2U6_9PSEU